MADPGVGLIDCTVRCAQTVRLLYLADPCCVCPSTQVLNPDKDEENSALEITSQDSAKQEGQESQDDEMKDVEVSSLPTGLLVVHYSTAVMWLLFSPMMSLVAFEMFNCHMHVQDVQGN